MWYPNPASARLVHDRQLRTLYACVGVSIALHGLAMFAFPALRLDRPAEARALTALFMSRSEPAESVAPAPPPRMARERRQAEPSVPVPRPVDPATVAVPVPLEPAPVPAPAAQAAAPASVASVSPQPVPDAPTELRTEAFDANLFDAYRLALIDAAKRYKRYPVQAMERGWEGRVEVRVVVGANGLIKSALVKSSSRYQILDDQALDMVRKAFNALAQIQPAPRGREFTVDVPVIFELQTG
jgi:protein TonB